MIGGSRIETHALLSHYHDKGHDWCIHCLNCIAMQVLSSAAVSCRFCRHSLPPGSIYCRPAVNQQPMDSFGAGDYTPLAVAILFSRWHSSMSREAVLRLWKSPEECIKENRGRLCMAVHFRSVVSMHFIELSSRGDLSVFPSLVNLLIYLAICNI